MDILKKIIRETKGNRKVFIIGVLVLILNAVILLIIPYFSKVMIDDVIKQGIKEEYALALFGIVGLSILSAFMHYIGYTRLNKSVERMKRDIKNKIYRHLQELSFSFYDKNKIGELFSRLVGDVDMILMFVITTIPNIILNIIYFTGALIILSYMNWKLALVSLSILPFVGITTAFFNKKLRPLYRELREYRAELNAITQERIAGIRVIKAFAREKFSYKQFEKANKTVVDENIHVNKYSSVFSSINTFLAEIPAAILLFFGGLLVLQGPDTLTLGELIAFTGYLWMLVMPIGQMAGIITQTSQAITSGRKIFNILDLGSRVKLDPNGYATEVKGNIKFENVDFYHSDMQVLHDINIDIPAGKTLAIMGATGSGKSSIINLIGRYYNAGGGTVSVEGVDVKKWNYKALRASTGIVMQETFLFSDSIENNIRYGKPDATKEEVVAAAKLACAHDFIQKMPEGYESSVGERGSGLSGGQKQRVAIARAIIGNPRILIMDDSTSALDMETERKIQEGMKRKLEGCTTIIIAHRISSVKDADEIIVLDNGRIAERGTHDELLEMKSKYYNIFSQQYSNYEEYKEQKKLLEKEVVTNA